MSRYLKFFSSFLALLFVVTLTVMAKAQQTTNDFTDDENNTLFPSLETFGLLNYDWEISPTSSKLNADERKEQVVFQKYHYALEYLP